MEEKQNKQVEEVKCKECKKAQGVNMPLPWLLIVAMDALLAVSVFSVGYLLLKKPVLSSSEMLIFVFFAIVSFMPGFFMAFLYVKFNMIGRYLFFFIDKEGERHVHLEPPKPGVHSSLQPLLRISLGGWLERDWVLGGSVNWSISCVNIKDLKMSGTWRVTIQDRWGNEITRSPWELLSIISRFSSVRGMFRTYSEREDILDAVGVGLLALSEKIFADRKKYGRSKAAQQIREDIESIFGSEQPRIPPDLSSRWRQQLEQRKVISEESESLSAPAQA